jgi:rod shape-determining protein MreC
MQNIINFLIKYRNLLLYLFLMILSVAFTVQSHSHHRNMFIHSSGNITSRILKSRSDVYSYFHLSERNKVLQQENAVLRMQLLAAGDTLLGAETTRIFLDTVPYRIMPARVIKNDFHKRDNYITIDIGTNQGIRNDMGVIAANGIVGLIDKAGPKYARVISVLNSNMSLNAQIKGTSTIGSLVWTGKDPYVMNLIDVPRLAKVKKGDTIITGLQSTSFPPDIMIGTVKKVALIDTGSRYDIEVKLFNDLTDLGYVNVIKMRDERARKRVDTLIVGDE